MGNSVDRPGAIHAGGMASLSANQTGPADKVLSTFLIPVAD